MKNVLVHWQEEPMKVDDYAERIAKREYCEPGKSDVVWIDFYYEIKRRWDGRLGLGEIVYTEYGPKFPTYQ